ncbi:MAG: hypothetical protein ABIR25_05105 [Sphingomicrobium sp.]
MVIRRIREHVTAHNWFAVAIDIGIVVVGVFFGLQGNNWNEARIERDNGRAYRARLIEDLRSNEADMRARAVFYGAVRRHAASALDAFDRPSDDRDEALLVDAVQAAQTWPKSLKRFTYDEILSAGEAERLGSPSLREKIDNFYVGAAVAGSILTSDPPYRDQLRRIMPYVVQHRVASSCGNRFHANADYDLLVTLAPTCDLDLDPDAIRDSVARIRATPEIKLDLTQLMVDLDFKLAAFRIVEGRARGLREKIAAEPD